jgi:hypothetical protein
VTIDDRRDTDSVPTGGIADDWLLWIAVALTFAREAPTAYDVLTGRLAVADAFQAFSPLLYAVAAIVVVLIAWGWLRSRRRAALENRYVASVLADGIWNATSYARARNVPHAFSIRTFTIVATDDRIEVWQGFITNQLVATWLARDITSLSAGPSSERIPATTLRVTTGAGTTSLLLLESRWFPVARMRGTRAVALATTIRELLATNRPRTVLAPSAIRRPSEAP